MTPTAEAVRTQRLVCAVVARSGHVPQHGCMRNWAHRRRPAVWLDQAATTMRRQAFVWARRGGDWQLLASHCRTARGTEPHGFGYSQAQTGTKGPRCRLLLLLFGWRSCVTEEGTYCKCRCFANSLILLYAISSYPRLPKPYKNLLRLLVDHTCALRCNPTQQTK